MWIYTLYIYEALVFVFLQTYFIGIVYDLPGARVDWYMDIVWVFISLNIPIPVF